MNTPRAHVWKIKLENIVVHIYKAWVLIVGKISSMPYRRILHLDSAVRVAPGRPGLPVLISLGCAAKDLGEPLGIPE